MKFGRYIQLGCVVLGASGVVYVFLSLQASPPALGSAFARAGVFEAHDEPTTLQFRSGELRSPHRGLRPAKGVQWTPKVAAIPQTLGALEGSNFAQDQARFDRLLKELDAIDPIATPLGEQERAQYYRQLSTAFSVLASYVDGSDQQAAGLLESSFQMMQERVARLGLRPDPAQSERDERRRVHPSQRLLPAPPPRVDMK